MQLPVQLLNSLENVRGFDRKEFKKVHESGEQITSIRINPIKNPILSSPNSGLWTLDSGLLPVPWSQYGYYLSERPSFTFDPLFHAGCYYVQEASSMFLEQALKQTVDLSKPLKILDLSAAPGGKSTHIQSLISTNSFLISNEVIRSRANILKDNIIKWGCNNVIVTNNDPSDFSRLENYFDVIVVDAPCSGSGLFRKEPGAVDEWSENNVQLCSKRQQRILADIIPALKNEGILIYSTCSYSEKEDEEISEWLMQSFPLRYRPLETGNGWGIVDTGKGFRFWPNKLKGEGFYMACFQKTGSGEKQIVKTKKKFDKINKSESVLISDWITKGEKELIRHDQTIYIWPANLAENFHLVLDRLRVIYSGVLAGELMRDKFIPSHALALSNEISPGIRKLEMNYEDAIRYLQRKSPEIVAKEKGWQIVTYKKFALGWVNVLPGRINNYYPKELRIIKDN